MASHNSEFVALQPEKADQALALLRDSGLDCWLTFVRESAIHPDPGHEAVVGADVVRSSAFLFSASGARVAIVAQFDTAAIIATGIFSEVIGYDDDLRGPLLNVLTRLNPRQIGLNYSADDVTADGLTYGHWLRLTQMLQGTPFAERLTSAGPLLARLRGRKSTEELSRIRRAVAITEECITTVTPQIRIGMSEQEIAGLIHREFARHGVDTAWARESCPVVNIGPDSNLGHCGPSASLRLEPGQLIHVDLGVKWGGYCSDLQRMWYVRRPGETQPPASVQRAFATVSGAIEAAAAVLRPGTPGHVVDAAARQYVIAAGYPEFMHAVGHGLGKAVHDGGTMLGPHWACYGKMVDNLVEAGNVFTLELSVLTEAGVVGLEEDVLVTESGCEFLSTFQKSPILI